MGTLCRAASPVDTPPCGTPKKQNGNGNETPEIVEDEGCQPEMEYEDEFEIENQEAAPHPATSIADEIIDSLEPIVEEEEEAAPTIQEENENKPKERESSDTQN